VPREITKIPGIEFISKEEKNNKLLQKNRKRREQSQHTIEERT
jgi:hypothetical protein